MITTKVFAKAVLVYDGKILILRRSADDDYMPSTPDLPGGEIDDGEEIGQGLIRELFEEIGQTIDGKKLHLAYSFTGMKLGSNFVRLYFVGQLQTDKVILSKEHDDVMWLTLEEAIEKNTHPTQNQFLRYIKENQLLA